MKRLRGIPVEQLEAGMSLFRPSAFSAYSIGADMVPLSRFGPEIQGDVFEVLEVDGRTVHARRERDGREYIETAPDSIEHVLIRTEED